MPPTPLTASPATVAPVSLAVALRFWFTLGWISFGGPAGQIAILHEALVVQRRWISERRFLHALNYCMLLPGPEAQQLATYIGYLLHRTPGAIAAGVLFVLPSLLILVGLSWLYVAFGHTALVAGLFYGIKPAVAALVLAAVQRLAARALKAPWQWALALSAFVALVVLALPFPLIIGVAALCGWGAARRQGRAQPASAPVVTRGGAPTVPPASVPAGAPAQAPAPPPHPPALIDDDTPPPQRPLLAHSARVVGVGVLLWTLPMGLATLGWGWGHTLTQMAWFFTKAALLTFGGAYAVLPYVYQGAVAHYAWITPAQMIDGLALGETTPGPLIMVVVFVGFVGAWQDPAVSVLFGPGAHFAGAALAAMLVCWFTFLPSFIFILAGAPLIEATHGDLRFTAPLSAIMAAVVGVVAALALLFAVHILWPQGRAGGPDGVAAVLTAAAALALLRYKRGVMTVIFACAATGLALRLLLR